MLGSFGFTTLFGSFVFFIWAKQCDSKQSNAKQSKAINASTPSFCRRTPTRSLARPLLLCSVISLSLWLWSFIFLHYSLSLALFFSLIRSSFLVCRWALKSARVTGAESFVIWLLFLPLAMFFSLHSTEAYSLCFEMLLNRHGTCTVWWAISCTLGLKWLQWDHKTKH